MQRLPPRRGKLSAKRTDEGRTYGSYPVMGGHGSFLLIRPSATFPLGGRLLQNYFLLGTSTALPPM